MTEGCGSCHQLPGRPHTDYCQAPDKEGIVTDQRRNCARCPEEATHVPCCSSHGHSLCCQCYRTTHFVEVGPCCGQPTVSRSLTEALADLEREDPEVAAAKARLDATVDRIIGRGPATSFEDVQRIYGTPPEAD